ncbi:MAG: Wadjet anti-phage system protein JetD domain-containing protein [Halanaerobium sp.]|nr:Wadjet anti-phage system protein JetD domain-containing protein [Halanaerobium sp.]
MVKEHERFNQLFKLFEDEILKGRKRFTLIDLENFLLATIGGVTKYEDAGGYRALYWLVKAKEEQGELTAINSSPLNGRIPPLKTRWQMVDTFERGWNERLILRLSRQLDLTYFLKRPALQSAELGAKLARLADFFIQKDKREWASREERSLEIFGDEKFLASPEGKRLLARLKLSLKDLKAEKYSRMFVYWNRGTSEIKKVLILENHSAFISCKRALEAGCNIFCFEPDTLIFGEGKHIIDSLKFLDEIAIWEEVQLKYAGDIDPEGLAIYVLLKEKYPDLMFDLHLNYYEKMLTLGEEGYPLKSQQQKKRSIIDAVTKELKGIGRVEMANKFEQLWKANLRIPQEVITFEVLQSKQNSGGRS